MNGVVSKEEFQKMPDVNKWGVMYEMVYSIYRRKKLDTLYITLGGILGGAAVLIPYLMLFK